MSSHYPVYLLTVLVYSCISCSGVECQNNISDFLDGILANYDSRFPPNFQDTGRDRQVPIAINIYVNSMYDISEANMDYSMSMFLRERWVDERLAYGSSLNVSRLELGEDFLQMIWRPDVYILNEKDSRYHEVTVPNTMTHVYPDGTVQISMRVTGTFSCQMYLQKYPFDTQYCYLDFESYSKSTETLVFAWNGRPVTVADGISFPQFSLRSTSAYNCDKDYYGIVYPCVGVRFELRRNYSYHLTQIYVPSLLVVLLSWVSFWLDSESVPARISLGLLTILTMTTQSSGARVSLPRVSYIKAIDIWMAVCLVYVFLALLEYAYVNVQSRQRKRKLQNQQNDKKEINGDSSKAPDMSQINLQMKQKRQPLCCKKLSGLDRARLTDRVSRVLFPVSFLLFNVGYWLFYFLWEPDNEATGNT